MQCIKLSPTISRFFLKRRSDTYSKLYSERRPLRPPLLLTTASQSFYSFTDTDFCRLDIFWLKRLINLLRWIAGMFKKLGSAQPH